MKRILMLLLAMIMAVSMTFCFTACGEDEDAGDGSGDSGSGDTGSGDTGSSDTGSGDTGAGDSGSGDTGSGDREEDGETGEIRAIYNSYVVAVTARGETPLSYEEWLATVKGEKGDPGAPGKDGTVWHVGEGAPSSVSGAKLGDFYINKTSFEVYHLTASGWSLLGSIKGEDGEDASGSGSQGTPGKDGTVWHTGAGVPSGISAKEGDLYLDTASSDVYKYSSGSWSKITNIKGEDGEAGAPGTGGSGTVWHFGSGAPTDVDGAKEGDCYLDTDSYTIYRLEGGTWAKIAAADSGNSGGNTSDVDSYRQEIKDYASQRFEALASKYDIAAELSEEFFNLIDKLSITTTIEELDNIYVQLKEVLAKIEGNASGDGELYISYYYLTFDQGTMVLGTDIDDFMNEYFVGTSIIAVYSDGSEVTAHTFYDDSGVNVVGSWANVGDVFTIEVSMGLGYDTVELSCDVRVIADLSGAEATVYYFDSSSVFGESATVYKMSDGSVVFEADGYQSAAELDGDVLTVFAPIATYVLELYPSAVRNTVKYYQPTDAPFVTLTQNDGDVTYSVSFYGDYDVAGEYIMILSNVPEESMNGLSIYSYINLEARLFKFPLGGGDTYLQFLEDFTIAPMSFTDNDECFFDIAVMDDKCDDAVIDQRLYHDFAESMTVEELLEIWCPLAGYSADGARVILNNELVSDYTMEITPRATVWIAPENSIVITGSFTHSEGTTVTKGFLPVGATLEVFVGMYGGATRDIYINGEPVEYETNRERLLYEGDEISITVGGEGDVEEDTENPDTGDDSMLGQYRLGIIDDLSKVPDDLWLDIPYGETLTLANVFYINGIELGKYQILYNAELFPMETSTEVLEGIVIGNNDSIILAPEGAIVIKIELECGDLAEKQVLHTFVAENTTVQWILEGYGLEGALEVIVDGETVTEPDKATVKEWSSITIIPPSAGTGNETVTYPLTLFITADEYSAPNIISYTLNTGTGTIYSVSVLLGELDLYDMRVIRNGILLDSAEYDNVEVCSGDTLIIAPATAFTVTLMGENEGERLVLCTANNTVAELASAYTLDYYSFVYIGGNLIDASEQTLSEGDYVTFTNAYPDGSGSANNAGMSSGYASENDILSGNVTE